METAKISENIVSQANNIKTQNKEDLFELINILETMISTRQKALNELKEITETMFQRGKYFMRLFE